MTAPPFVFNHRTGVLKRTNATREIEITLSRFHAEIFGTIAAAQGPITVPGIARSINTHWWAVRDEIPRLATKLEKLGIRIASERGRGKWLIVDPIPKWKPTIAPPVRLEGEDTCPVR